MSSLKFLKAENYFGIFQLMFILHYMHFSESGGPVFYIVRLKEKYQIF
jgi:hypothetical protein